jgi:hypothetical protein
MPISNMFLKGCHVYEGLSNGGVHRGEIRVRKVHAADVDHQADSGIDVQISSETIPKISG